jgi:hypothetical protein
MVFELLISALEDLGASTFKMPDVATGHVQRYIHAGKAQPCRCYGAGVRAIQDYCGLEQWDLLESFRQHFGNISNTSSTQQSQSLLMLKNYMLRECGTVDIVASEMRAHMVGVCQPMLKSMDVQERISFKISSRKPALGMYQPLSKAEAEAQRRTASSTVTAGRSPRERWPPKELSPHRSVDLLDHPRGWAARHLDQTTTGAVQPDNKTTNFFRKGGTRGVRSNRTYSLRGHGAAPTSPPGEVL